MSRPATERIVDVARSADIWDRLLEYYTTAQAKRWMVMPHPQLEHEWPIRVITAGEPRRVQAILDRLDADAYL